jgi:hypothetical protein
MLVCYRNGNFRCDCVVPLISCWWFLFAQVACVVLCCCAAVGTDVNSISFRDENIRKKRRSVGGSPASAMCTTLCNNAEYNTPPPVTIPKQTVQKSMSAQEASKFVQQVSAMEDFLSFIGLIQNCIPFLLTRT